MQTISIRAKEIRIQQTERYPASVASLYFCIMLYNYSAKSPGHKDTLLRYE